MKSSYVPKDVAKMVFEEYKRFFRSCPEVANFLTADQLTVLSWYFAGDTAIDGLDREAKYALLDRMIQELGRGDKVRRWDQLEFAMKKLRSRHRLLVAEIEAGIDPAKMKVFLPWKDWPRGPDYSYPTKG